MALSQEHVTSSTPQPHAQVIVQRPQRAKKKGVKNNHGLTLLNPLGHLIPLGYPSPTPRPSPP